MKHLYISDSIVKQFFITQNFIIKERTNILFTILHSSKYLKEKLKGSMINIFIFGVK
jgi:hypothetical protein